MPCKSTSNIYVHASFSMINKEIWTYALKDLLDIHFIVESTCYISLHHFHIYSVWVISDLCRSADFIILISSTSKGAHTGKHDPQFVSEPAATQTIQDKVHIVIEEAQVSGHPEDKPYNHIGTLVVESAVLIDDPKYCLWQVEKHERQRDQQTDLDQLSAFVILELS